MFNMCTACDTAHVKSVLRLLLNMLQHVLGNSIQFNFCARQVVNKETPRHWRKAINLIYYSVKQKTHFSIKHIGTKMLYFIPYFMRHFSYYKIKKIRLPLLLRFAYFLFLFLGFHLLTTFLPYRWLFFKRLFYHNFFVILNFTINISA